jgi:hypothetical protein
MLPFIVIPARIMGQIQMKDNPISLAAHDQRNPSIATPSQVDFTVVVWEDDRHAATNGADIYIQRISNETGIPQWIGEKLGTPGQPYDVVTERFDGIPVCRAENDQRTPRAAYDGMDGVIVTWEDFRNDPSGAIADIYALRFELSTGRPDPNWPVDGIPVCQTGFHAERPRIAGTVDGAYIVWIDHRSNQTPPPINRDVYVQYIQSATASWPPAPTLWVADGVSVPVLRNPDQVNPEPAVDNIFTIDMLGSFTQGVIVTYQDNRYNSAANGTPAWTVFANRISADGIQMYTAGVPPAGHDVPVAPSHENQTMPRLVTTGKLAMAPDPSAIIVWQDEIEDPDPMHQHTDIYSQRLDAYGTPMFPGANGLPVCQAPLWQSLPQLTLWEAGDPSLGSYVPFVTVGWEDRRDEQQNGVDIYAALIDATPPGLLVNPQGVNGDPICTLPNDQTELSMDNLDYPQPDQEFTVFVWTHDGADGKDIWYQKILLPQWTQSYPSNGFPVTEAKGDQVLPQANREVFVWQDGRRGPIPHDPRANDNIYCQTPGTCTGDTEMKWRDVFAKWTFGEDARDFRYVVHPEEGTMFVVWTEDRDYAAPHDMVSIVFIQKLDRDGVPRWSNNGVAVNEYGQSSTQTPSAKLPDVCIAKDGGAMVVWQQSVPTDLGREECPGVFFDAMGVPTDHKLRNFSYDVVDREYTEPRIVSTDGDEAAVAVLMDNGNRRIPEVLLVDEDMENQETEEIDTAPVTDNAELQMITDGLGIVYTLTRSDLSSCIVLAAVDVLSSPPAAQDVITIPYNSHLVVADGLSAPTYPDIARVPNSALSTTPRGVVVWEGGGEMGPCYPARPTEIYGQFVFYDDNLVNPEQWPDARMIGPGVGNYHQTRPNVQPAGADAVSVFWYDSQTGNDGVMGTRLPELNNEIAWAKDRNVEKESSIPADLAITGIWPQPAPHGSDVSVALRLPVGISATAEIHDLFGRRIAVIYDDAAPAGELMLRLVPGKLGLVPGMYLLRLRSASMQVARPLLILR